MARSCSAPRPAAAARRNGIRRWCQAITPATKAAKRQTQRPGLPATDAPIEAVMAPPPTRAKAEIRGRERRRPPRWIPAPAAGPPPPAEPGGSVPRCVATIFRNVPVNRIVRPSSGIGCGTGMLPVTAMVSWP